jgi:hypothetical protein
MNQQPLNLYTQFELTTAAQLCLERNRDEPNDKDLADAVVMCGRWNKQRKECGLVAWR